jgi:ABC-type glycerol-3-phosphate transport system permease component
MNGFFDDISFSFEEATLCDVCKRFRGFFKMVLPMVTMGLAVKAVFCGTLVWNEFLFAIIIGTMKWVLMPPTIFTMS